METVFGPRLGAYKCQGRLYFCCQIAKFSPCLGVTTKAGDFFKTEHLSGSVGPVYTR